VGDVMRMNRVIGAACVALACSGVVWAQPKAASAGSEPKKPSLVFRTADAAIPGMQGFSVVLVLGDLQGAATADNVPAAARKALADMKDFLPYKSYHLLDAAWILGSSRSANRLRGPDDVEYELGLGVSPGAPDAKALRIEFVLRESGDTPKPRPPSTEAENPFRTKQRIDQLMRERTSVEKEVIRLGQTVGDKDPARVNASVRLAELNREIGDIEGKVRAMGKRGGGQIISTTFSMDIGETVVVGTSRLRGGDKALIALLTAVPKK